MVADVAVKWEPPTGRCRYRCRTCGQVFTAWAPAQRHANEHGGARVEIVAASL